jgi:hypothetical protein
MTIIGNHESRTSAPALTRLSDFWGIAMNSHSFRRVARNAK